MQDRFLCAGVQNDTEKMIATLELIFQWGRQTLTKTLFIFFLYAHLFFFLNFKITIDLMKLRWMKRGTISNKQLTCVGCLDSVSSLGSAGHAESWAGRAGSEDTGSCRRACAVHHPVSCARRPAPGGVRTITECGRSLYLPEPCTSRAGT